MDIGQTIKRLRRERNFTQEDLAEQLNITAQAVSKWENGIASPDISQLGPLMRVFGVSADTLLGFDVTDDGEEVMKIICAAHAMEAEDGEDGLGILDSDRAHKYLLDALKKYPNNMELLDEAIVGSVNRALILRGTDDARVAEYYAETERLANLMITYGDLSHQLDGRRILVSMYQQFGDYEKAEPHVAAYPNSRFCGFEVNRGSEIAYHKMLGNDNDGAIKQYCGNVYSILNVLSSQLHIFASLYNGQKRYEDAITVRKAMLKLCDVVYDGAEYTPLHSFFVETHSGIFESYFLSGDEESAYEWLDKMIEFHIAQEPHYNAREQPASPLVREWDFSYPGPNFPEKYDAKGRLLRYLNVFPWFDAVRETPRFKAVLDRVNAL